jgi:signal transduction histidine kinase
MDEYGAKGDPALDPRHTGRFGRWRRRLIRRALTATGRGWVLLGQSLWNATVLVLVVGAASLVPLGFGLALLPLSLVLLRDTANTARRRALKWSGVEIEELYRPLPAPGVGFAAKTERLWSRLSDPQIRRDLLWTLLDPIVGALLASIAAGMFLYGVYGYFICVFWQPLTHAGFNDWYTFIHVGRTGYFTFLRWLLLPIGTALIVGSGRAAPALIRAHSRWTAVLLGPTSQVRQDVLAHRVARLTETRADAVDIQAAELRRIERDLHDGAQARLVAMGMNLGAAEALLERHPEAARALLIEARESSAKALTELRELVRGIHPPVLADRGLGDAVRALALDSALSVEVTADLPGRLEPAVESAAYFAVSELLTNVAKHAHASSVRVDLWHRDRRLRVTCADDGRGGAVVGPADAVPGSPAPSPARPGGSGLAGIERRIAAFDGIMAVHSPAGGPTTITLEIPCASSSAKTSSS